MLLKMSLNIYFHLENCYIRFGDEKKEEKKPLKNIWRIGCNGANHSYRSYCDQDEDEDEVRHWCLLPLDCDSSWNCVYSKLYLNSTNVIPFSKCILFRFVWRVLFSSLSIGCDPLYVPAQHQLVKELFPFNSIENFHFQLKAANVCHHSSGWMLASHSVGELGAIQYRHQRRRHHDTFYR